jgi:class 3 adenylate cyclase/tetratricopeptide (TPR) repeat protein
MVCSSCGTENRAGRKFCAQCGSQLAVSCPSCGAANEPGERFCGECGTPLEEGIARSSAPAVSRPKGTERRHVSVLFADLVGFTTLSEHRDPEEVRELLSRYFDSAQELIARYGGTVEKFIGDAVMAVWGTPVSHEDDAERAVRAALELVETVAAMGAEVGAEDLRLRAGVHTGEAAVTLGATGQGMVAGDLVNTASRLQSVATPGTVLVGESTYLSVRDVVAFEEAGEHTLKGKEVPVRAWRALRVVAQRGGARTEMLEAPFVGRDRELRLLKELFHATEQERRPRLLSVMGVGGIGKSRLGWEFLKYVDGLVYDVYWHQGRSPSYGEGVTFWALGEIVRMRCGIAESEEPGSSTEKLRAALAQYVPDPEERKWIEPRVAHLLGLEERPPGEREELFAAWRTFFERVADGGPTVLVFEDLQWADPGLIDFIEHVLEWTRTHPIFILTLSRPELMDRRPTWGAGQRSFTSIHLEPLDDASMWELLKGLAPGLTEPLVRQIVDRAEGIPLYAVETVRMLVDQGRLTREGGRYALAGEIEALEVPDSLHALIAARLDVLEQGERTLLQDASVLGKTFTVSALAALSTLAEGDLEPRLRDLTRKEVLTFDADPRSPERGQFGFVQSLIREVAYQTLSKRDRRSKHLAAAEYFERSGDDELASLVASHYVEAYRASPEGAEAAAVAERARVALAAAAERAQSLGSNAQAVVYLEQAVSVTEDPAERATLSEAAAVAAHAAGDFDHARDELRAVLQWYRESGDHAAVRRATTELSSVLLEAGDVDEAVQLLESGMEGVVEDDDASAAGFTSQLARAYLFMGEYQKAYEWADRAVGIAERHDSAAQVADSLITRAITSYYSGRPHEATAILMGVLALAQDEGLLREETRARLNLADGLSVVDPRRGIAVATTGLDLGRRLGHRTMEVYLAANVVLSAIPVGEWQRARTLLESTLGEGGDLASRVAGGLFAILLAYLGEDEAARARLADTRAAMGSSTDPQDRAILGEGSAAVALASGRLEEARKEALSSADLYSGPSEIRTLATAVRASLWLRDEASAVVALKRLENTYLRGEWARNAILALSAGVAGLEGRRDEAAAMFDQAALVWRDLGTRFDLAMTFLDRLIVLGADAEGADALAAEARSIFESLGARPFLSRLDSLVGARQPV